MDNIQGTQLEGRYLIEELVGVGGMANVYKAFDTVENRPVAVKMLRDEYANNEEMLRRFRNESKAIYSLNHPNIVKIYDVVLNIPNPFIVMEYVDGITLKDYIEKRHVVKPRTAVALTAQILTALAHAHDNGIIHRDVKPQNVMIKSDGTIKVMDFGIARFALSTTGTITGSAIGSVHYVSPEQAQGEAAIDCRTDIYSVGVMMYEMLTGRLPFEGDSPVAVALKHVSETPASPRSVNPEIPIGLEEITMRAMAKDPALRYQTAGEMLADLDLFARDPNCIFGYSEANLREAPAVQMAGAQTGQPAADRQKKKKKPRKKKSFLTKMFAVTCAVVIGSLIFVYAMFQKYQPFKAVDNMEMPDLVGLQYQQVLDSSRYDNLEVVLETQEFNSSFAVGEIYEQSPAAGKTVKVGCKVKVKVSNGALNVTLPSFVNQEATSVYGKLIELGLYYSTVEINSDTISEGYVVRTDPAADSTVSSGTTVQVYVSRGSGKEMAIVPDCLGKDVEDARTLLKSSELNVQITYVSNRSVDEGTVLAQSPSYPSQVPIGTTVTLTVASETVNTKVITVKFVPPDIDEEVLFTAMQDGTQVFSNSYIPAAERTISITFRGEGTSLADIFLNGELYGSVQLDFDAGTYIWTVDNSDQFEPEE